MSVMMWLRVLCCIMYCTRYAAPCSVYLHEDKAHNGTRSFMQYQGSEDIGIVFINVYVPHTPSDPPHVDTDHHREDTGSNTEEEIDEHEYSLHNGSSASSISSGSSVAPWRWAWARSDAAFMLRMPIDYQIMSLGVLAMSTRYINVYFDDVPRGCMSSGTADAAQIEHEIARILIQNVTMGTGYSSNGFAQDGGGVCRYAYMNASISSSLPDLENFIGFKCCAWSKHSGRWKCDLEQTSGILTTWFGPLIMVGWGFVILIVRAVAELRQMKGQKIAGARQLLLKRLKQNMITQMKKVTSKVPLANKPSQLITKYDKNSFMDVIAISKKVQLHLARLMKSLFGIFVVFCYYAYIVASMVFYNFNRPIISNMASSQEVALNVFSHIGWIFANDNLFISYYGMAELVLTCFIPVFILVMYAYQKTSDDSTLPNSHSGNKIHPEETQANNGIPEFPDVLPEINSLPQTDDTQAKTYMKKSGVSRCLHSGCGRALHAFCFLVVVLYVMLVASVHVAYISYFVLKGALLSMTVLATWLLPAGLMYQYIKSIFLPLNTSYIHVKQRMFEMVEKEASHLTIKKHDIIFIPRSLLEEFYRKQARRKVFECVQKAMVALTALILLFLVLFSSGSSALQQNSSSILGVNLALLLPILGRAMEVKPIPEMEKRTIDKELCDYLKEKENSKKDLTETGDLFDNSNVHEFEEADFSPEKVTESGLNMSDRGLQYKAMVEEKSDK